MRSYRVPLGLIEHYRPQIEPFLKLYCSKPFSGGWTAGKIIEDAKFDQILLWLVLDEVGTVLGVAATQVRLEDSPSRIRICMLAGRDWGGWRHLLRDVIHHGQARGCKKLTFEGRKGWKRLLPEFSVVGQTGSGHLIYERAIL
ncbi:hypothetical protein [uncultured Cohaesibacter sp.]|uniref:hypothetical protein n=1 Tax=uncultured Cohaesibacter sp. TaxID=1002546 RepID=UPI0029C97659|nr:hypothetical protein [uncultured Cohaesibacter sp.]